MYDILLYKESQIQSDTQKGGLPSAEGRPSGRKKGGMPMYVTYSDLIQIGIFIVALVIKSKLLDFPTNPNLGEIQTFLQIT